MSAQAEPDAGAGAVAGAVVVAIELLRENGKATPDDIVTVGVCRREVARTALDTLEERGWVERMSPRGERYYATERLADVGTDLARRGQPLHEHAQDDLDLDRDSGVEEDSDLAQLTVPRR